MAPALWILSTLSVFPAVYSSWMLQLMLRNLTNLLRKVRAFTWLIPCTQWAPQCPRIPRCGIVEGQSFALQCRFTFFLCTQINVQRDGAGHFWCCLQIKWSFIDCLHCIHITEISLWEGQETELSSFRTSLARLSLAWSPSQPGHQLHLPPLILGFHTTLNRGICLAFAMASCLRKPHRFYFCEKWCWSRSF